MSCVRYRIVAAGLLVVLCAAGTAAADDPRGDAPDSESSPGSLGHALTSGLFAIDLRYRLEHVDDEAFEKNALASTLRGVLSYETGTFRGFSAGVRVETVTAIGNDLLYNNLGDGDLNNGVTDRPVVADPALVEIDNLYLAYQGPHGLQARAGKFNYSLDNRRFIGTAPWRQNERSYEGLSFAIGSQRTVLATYAYLGRAYYNNGTTRDLEAHLFNLSRELGPGALTGYAYLLDWEAPARDELSSATYGLRFVGESRAGSSAILYFAEYARQGDYGENPGEFSLGYAHLGLGVGKGDLRLQAGWELKGGDGVSAVQTPLGSNHGKNGYADRLVVTPPEGSEDSYIQFSMDREKWGWLVAYHDFRAARGTGRLGSEIDFVARYTPVDPLSVFLKVADYRADSLSDDVTKVWLWAAWRFDTTF